MTELEKLQRAKMYIDKLANGINPQPVEKVCLWQTFSRMYGKIEQGEKKCWNEGKMSAG